MSAEALLFTLAALGIATTSYLIKKRRALDHPVCPLGGQCEEVLTSKYNKFFGIIHNDIAGFLFYIYVAISIAFIELGSAHSELIAEWLFYIESFALLMSIYFFFLQWKVIKAWCFWCLMSAANVLAMFLITLTNTYLL